MPPPVKNAGTILTGDKTSSPAVVNGIVYIASHDGNIYAFE